MLPRRHSSRLQESNFAILAWGCAYGAGTKRLAGDIRGPAAGIMTSDTQTRQDDTTAEPKRRFKFPTAFTVLFFVLVLVWILTFIIKPGGTGRPARKHELGLFLAGQWHTLHFRPQFAATNDPIEKLDVTLLQKYVLDPVFGIDDPRTSKRINFVGGIRGPGELEKLVGSGEYACAFAMFPTSIEDLMTIADAGGIMPPKSTWFEPKLRDAMFCHMIG